MIQKYVLLLDEKNEQLVIQEHAELDKELLTFLCEERYPVADIKSAMEIGRDNLIGILRTDNFYPPLIFSDMLAQRVESLFETDGTQSEGLVLDDTDFITKDQIQAAIEEDIDETDTSADEILEDGVGDNYEEKIKNLRSSIKIADDENLDIEDDK